MKKTNKGRSGNIGFWRIVGIGASLGFLGYVFVATRMATNGEQPSMLLNIIVVVAFMVITSLSVEGVKCPSCKNKYFGPPLFLRNKKCLKCGYSADSDQ